VNLPPLDKLTFVSDAAGARFTKVQGRFIPFLDQHGGGAASISAVEDGAVWFHAAITWPLSLLLEARDSADHAYGCKSQTLEAVAAMLPLLCCPQHLIGKDVLLLTDNEALVFGWDPRRIPHDESASKLIRAMHIIAAFLNCNITMQHIPRNSTPSAILADRLTRASTTTTAEKAVVASVTSLLIPAALMDWLHGPSEDWELPARLLHHVKDTLHNLEIHIS
jgi:hypothetical protein